MRLIDADALMKRMEDRVEDLITDYGHYDSYVNGFEEGMVAVEDALTVDAVPVVHGRWERITDFGDGKCYGYCSVCRTVTKATNIIAFLIDNNFCRYCGALMDGERRSGE